MTTPDGDGGLDVLFVGFVVAFVVVVGVLTLVLVVRNLRLARKSQLDPTSLQSMLSRSPALAPRASLEERLEEIEALHRAGKITDEERAAARAQVLGGS